LIIKYQHRFLADNAQKHKKVVEIIIYNFIMLRFTCGVCVCACVYRDLCHVKFIWMEAALFMCLGN